MKAALAATALMALSTTLPASAQTWSSHGQGAYASGSYGQPYGRGGYGGGSYSQPPYAYSQGGYGSGYPQGDYARYGYDYNGQQDRPGDYRCDAYWDRGRDDCDASWRDQRPYRSSYTGTRYGAYSSGGYGYRGHGAGGGYVYQPYNQGTQYYGAYGRPDQVYPGSGYGGHVGYGDYGQTYRGSSRSAWCASQYRSYDPSSGYYRAYSGRLIFCG